MRSIFWVKKSPKMVILLFFLLFFCRLCSEGIPTEALDDRRRFFQIQLKTGSCFHFFYGGDHRFLFVSCSFSSCAMAQFSVRRKRNLDGLRFLITLFEIVGTLSTAKIHTITSVEYLILFYFSWLKSSRDGIGCITSSQFLSSRITSNGFFLVTGNWTFSKAIYITNAIAFAFAESFSALNSQCNLLERRFKDEQYKDDKLLLNWSQLSFWNNSRV